MPRVVSNGYATLEARLSLTSLRPVRLNFAERRQQMDQNKRLRFEEYMAAAARAALAAEQITVLELEEFDWVFDTLSELLERYNDAAKPAAEEAARRRKR